MRRFGLALVLTLVLAPSAFSQDGGEGRVEDIAREADVLQQGLLPSDLSALLDAPLPLDELPEVSETLPPVDSILPDLELRYPDAEQIYKAVVEAEERALQKQSEQP
ncbi:MAG: hypothetical protein ACKVPX_04775 [Myxococcaceae bacterium]